MTKFTSNPVSRLTFPHGTHLQSSQDISQYTRLLPSTLIYDIFFLSLRFIYIYSCAP